MRRSICCVLYLIPTQLTDYWILFQLYLSSPEKIDSTFPGSPHHMPTKDKLFLSGFFFLISKRQPFLLHLPSNYQSSCRTFLLQNTGWEPPPTLIPTRAVSHQPWGKIELLYRRGYYRIISSTSLHFNKYKCKSLSNKWKIIIYSKQKFKCIQV